MANVINMGGGGANVQSKTVKSTTAKQTLTPPSGVDGFSPVIVSPMVLQEKTVTLSTSQQVLTPPSGVDGFSKVTVPAAPGDYFVDALIDGTFTVSSSGKQVTLPLSHTPSSLQDITVLVETSSNTSGTIMTAILRYSIYTGRFGDNGAILYANGNPVAVSSLSGVTGTINGNILTLNLTSGTVDGYSPVFGSYGRVTVVYKS